MLVPEPQAAQDGSRALAPVVAAGVLEPGLRLAVAADCRRVVVACGHQLLQTPELHLQVDQVGCAGEDVFAEGQLELERRPLVVQRDSHALLEGEIAALQARLAD